MNMATSRSTRAAILEDPEEDVAEAPTKGRKVETEQQIKSRLRNSAERFVLNNHKDEYYAKLEALHKDEGIEFKRVLTPEEKDEKELLALLERRPDLRAKIVQENSPEAVPDDERASA